MYKPGKYFERKFGVSTGTLRRWNIEHKLTQVVQLPGGKRLYSVKEVESLFNIGNNYNNIAREASFLKYNYVYARVSSAKQKDDLRRQVEYLQSKYPNHRVITDIASGVNFKRKGLQTILDHALKGMVNELVVMHKDRLARFGYELLEFIFKKLGIKLVVFGQNETQTTTTNNNEHGILRSDEQELAEDLLAINTLFVASYHGRRSAKNRKRKREERNSTNETTIE